MQTTAPTARNIAATLLALAAACGSGGPAQPPQKQFRHQNVSDLDSENGLLAVSLVDSCFGVQAFTLDPLSGDITYNIDVSSCGDLGNGMTPNLLGLSGLSADGLNTDNFDKWFAANPDAANGIMKYLVKCSLPYASSLSYTADDGSTYSWPGMFGLAPQWASGDAIPESEQQLVSACVAAHANKYGVHVPISVLGNLADGTPLPLSEDELASFPLPEGCFFGNLFTSDGVFSGDARVLQLGEEDSSLRACALPDRSGGGESSNCVPMQYAGRCDDVCQLDPSGSYYASCN